MNVGKTNEWKNNFKKNSPVTVRPRRTKNPNTKSNFIFVTSLTR